MPLCASECLRREHNPLPTFLDGVPTIRALVKFDISKNNLRAEGGKALAEALKGNKIMKELSIAGNWLSRKADNINATDMSGMIAISGAIPTMGALTSLNVSKNMLCGIDEYGNGTYDASGVTALADAIENHQ